MQSEHWPPSQIGQLTSIGVLVGMVGASVDRIRAKRTMMVVCATATVLAPTTEFGGRPA